MLHRVHSLCRCCDKPFLIRLGIGLADEQKFVFDCPECSAVLRGTLYLDHEEVSFTVKSDDFHQVDPDEVEGAGDFPAVAIYVDLPVHRSFTQKSFQPGPTPFVILMYFLEKGTIEEWTKRKNTLHQMRLQLFPEIRRAASFYSARDWSNLAKQLSDEPLAPTQKESDLRAIYTFNKVFQHFYDPILAKDVQTRLDDELQAHVKNCCSQHASEFRKLLTDLVDHNGFGQFRVKVVETALRCFDAFDAVIPPMTFEMFSTEWQGRVDEFRLFRDDFDRLKAIYVDAFELSSRALAYVGTVVNLAKRGDCRKWSNAGSKGWAKGEKRSVKDVLKMKAFERQFILSELPAASALYDAVDRHTRNDIGHYNVYYDFKSGCLIDEQGTQENFLLFLRDYLGVVRATSYLMSIVGSITYCYEAIVVQSH
jgi:hypothetical protein